MRRRTTRRAGARPSFRPRRLEDVFAIHLSRELRDPARIRFYVRLTRRYSMCLLTNALRSARKEAGTERITPEQFITAVIALLDEEKGGDRL